MAKVKMKEKTDRAENKKRRWLWLLLLLVILLGGTLAWMMKVQHDTEVEREANFNRTLELQHELDSLLWEHDKVKTDYAELTGQLTIKDSVILAKADSIRILLRRQADYYTIRRELNQLREESSVYMAHIDSLYRVTKVLEAENKEIKAQFQAEQVKTARLSEEREYFAEKVAVGSILKASNIQATAYRVKAGAVKATDKARRTDRIEICFTIQENLVVESGRRNLFLRVTRPDGKVLTRNDDHTFEFNGETIQYSVMERIRYLNKEMTLCLRWNKVDKDAEAMKGTYNLVLIIDDYVIGQSQLTLI